jgi:Tfp pilus assembly protein PilZ
VVKLTVFEYFYKPKRKGDPVENRRRSRRKPFVGPLEIYSKDNTKSLGKGHVTNVNEDGLAIVTPEKLALGDEVLLNFSIPNGWKFDFFGRVVYTEKGVMTNAYGVKFSPGQGTFIFKLV